MYATGTVRIDELLRGVAVLGARDAAVALAEGVSGSVEDFVAQMNRRALAIGLSQTLFRNPTGEPASGQTSTPRELATLAARLMSEHADDLPLFALRQLEHAGVRQDNPNLLLARDGSIGGLAVMASPSAGHGVVATALRDTPAGPRRLLVVLSGASSREAAAGEAQKLLNWGWQAWDAVRLYAAGQPVTTVPVWKGAANTVALGAAGALVVTVPRGDGARLQTTLTRTEPLVAPLVQGQEVGRIEVVTAGGTPVANVPLVVQQAVPLAGVLGRAWDAIRLWIR
jgi:D-alanyl-D-alanine carboxypeptidase (penicillin-binding protein 5/6)